jgi:hypothetical protein
MAERATCMVSGMNQHSMHPRDHLHARQLGHDAGNRFYPASMVARIAQRDLSTIHRWCRIGYLVGAIRGNGPGRQPWLIPAAECQRVAVTFVIPDEFSDHATISDERHAPSLSPSTTSRVSGTEGEHHAHQSPLDP